MSLTGPQLAKKAHDLLWAADKESNPTEKALLYAAATAHGTLATLAATVHGAGGLSANEIRWWEQNGVRK